MKTGVRQTDAPAQTSEPDLINAFRNPEILQIYIRRIRKKTSRLSRPVNIMEVCGGHTHAVLKYGLGKALDGHVRFLHGPGCPVCVIPRERIDHLIALAGLENSIVVTLGDVMRVPGSNGSPADWRARGRDIRFVYSPASAPEIALQNPGKKVFFFAAGFETTAPVTAYLVQTALCRNIKNLFFHINHVLVPPAMRALLADPAHEIDAFLAPSHVSVITGAAVYRPFATEYGLPVVAGGFEPADILEAVEMILAQPAGSERHVEIQYRRAADFTGNKTAQNLVDTFFEPRPDFRWRGLGVIPESALCLKPQFHRLDAELQFQDILPRGETGEDPGCLCSEILKGKKTPPQCPYFKKKCTPQSPAGVCMVSTEGACAAWYKYGD